MPVQRTHHPACRVSGLQTDAPVLPTVDRHRPMARRPLRGRPSTRLPVLVRTCLLLTFGPLPAPHLPRAMNGSARLCSRSASHRVTSPQSSASIRRPLTGGSPTPTAPVPAYRLPGRAAARRGRHLPVAGDPRQPRQQDCWHRRTDSLLARPCRRVPANYGLACSARPLVASPSWAISACPVSSRDLPRLLADKAAEGIQIRVILADPHTATNPIDTARAIEAEAIFPPLVDHGVTVARYPATWPPRSCESITT